MDSLTCVLLTLFATLLVSVSPTETGNCNPMSCLPDSVKTFTDEEVPTEARCAKLSAVSLCISDFAVRCPNADRSQVTVLSSMDTTCKKLYGPPGGQGQSGAGGVKKSPCIESASGCMKNQDKNIYDREPTDEELKANKNNVCTISKETSDCLNKSLTLEDCGEDTQVIDGIKQKINAMVTKCEVFQAEKPQYRDSAIVVNVSGLLLATLPVVLQALAWM